VSSILWLNTEYIQANIEVKKNWRYGGLVSQAKAGRRMLYGKSL